MKTYQELVKGAEDWMASHGFDPTDPDRLTMELYNKTPGKLHLEDGIDCPICLNRGTYMEIIDGHKYDPICECMKRRRAIAQLKKSGLYDMAKRYTLEAFKRETPWHKLMFESAERFLADESAWMYVGGQVGCGKTHICAAVVSKLVENNVAAKYLLWRDESTRLKGLLTEGSAYQRALTEVKEVPLLYIDDLFKTSRHAAMPSAGDINLAFEIINHRYNNRRLRTVISGEWTMDELCAFDEGIGSRIYERAKGCSVEIQKGIERNYRLSAGG